MVFIDNESQQGVQVTSAGGRGVVPDRAGSVWIQRKGRPAAMTEAQLPRLAEDGSRDAFEELVSRHADRLYLLALRSAGDAVAAEEIVQEAFLRALGGIGHFERRSRFFTWLWRRGLPRPQ